MLNQLQALEGWLLNHLMFTPDAPHGTPELLVTSTLEELSQEGCSFLTFGTVAGKSLGKIVGLSPFFAWWTRHLYYLTIKTLRLNGHRKFWEKFHPQSESSYLLLSEPKVGLREAMALMRALNAEFPTKE